MSNRSNKKEDNELSHRFASCTFTPITSDVTESSPIRAGDGGFSTTSFFMDSSGRSKFVLPLQLSCPTKEDLDYIQQSGCMPDPGIQSSGEVSGAVRFEITSRSPPKAEKAITVEEISVISCSVQGNSFLLETELVVRAFKVEQEPDSRAAFSEPIISESEIIGDFTNEGAVGAPTHCQLEVTAVLVTQKKNALESRGIPGLVALELSGGFVPYSEQSSTLQTRLAPFFLNLSLTQALKISVRAVPGSSAGSTLVSLTLLHSNSHDEIVTISNISLHAGHSRSDMDIIPEGQSMPGGQNRVTDMSKFVKWRYAPKTEPKLPLALHPRQAYSTVLTVDAGEDLRSRTFFSPISVTALVGGHRVVETTDAQWTTGRIAVEPADAFRVDMSLAHSSCHVGAPLVVSLRVLNLSHETRDLMLLMAKDEDKGGINAKHGSVNTAVVSEVNGYTFGVWGLSGDDDGTTRHSRDHELLAVDAALLLGEVRGQHSVDAELRFVPLREGTLDVPNLKLYDKTEGKWYNCSHMLKIVAAAKKE
jgi:hypothetical protein